MKIHIVNAFLFISLLCSSQYTSSQEIFTDSLSIDKKYGFQLVSHYHLGKVLKGYADFPERNFSSLAEINLVQQTYGKRYWNQLFAYPELGVSFIYGYLGNTRILGDMICVVPNITFRLIERKNWNFKVTLAMGFSYFTKPFHVENNPNNKLVGSRITNISYASFLLERKLSSLLSLSTGLSTFHCSNGHYQLPNVGINMPAYTIGLKYKIQEEPKEYIKHSIFEEERKVKFNTIIGMGVHEFGGSTEPVNGPKYKIYQLAFYLSKKVSEINNLQLGISVRYYSDFYEYINENDRFQNNLRLNSCVFTIFLAHELMANRFSFFTQGGINVFNPLKDEIFYIGDKYIDEKPFIKKLISTKMGVQYYLFDKKKIVHNNIFLGFYLNANFGQADFIETALGFTF